MLSADVTFTGSTAYSDVELVRAAAEVAQTDVNRGDISIAYDESAETYTLRFGTAVQSFGPGQLLDESGPGFTAYARDTTASTHFFTIYTVPFLSATYATDLDYNQYVAQAYWQINAADSSSQFTRFYAFVFGDNTAPGDVPVSGSAHWLVDIFGALAVPGRELRTISGSGDFQVDFAAGTYLLQSSVSESDFLTLGGVNGALYLNSGGNLRTDGSFGGLLGYSGTVDLDGTLEGSFFGPAAAEIGATFAASDATGATLNGSFTGQRSAFSSTSAGIPNVSLTNLLEEDRFFGDGVATTRAVRSDDPPDFASVSASVRDGTVEVGLDGVESISGAVFYRPDEADRIADESGNFDRYAFTNDDGEFEVAIYKIGDDNGEIALTYTSFIAQTALTSDQTVSATIDRREDRFYHFGVQTPDHILRGATGTASYNGVVYGRANRADRAQFDVTGTSRFNLDFGSDVYDGQLVLTGIDEMGADVDLGTWSFASELNGSFMQQASMTSPISNWGFSYIRPYLYGPTGEEIGAGFEAVIADSLDDPSRMYVAGVTVAARED